KKDTNLKKTHKDENLLKEQLRNSQKLNSILTLTEQKYRNLYDKTPTLLRTISVQGILTDCNEAYAKSLGYTKKEALGMSIYAHTAERSVKEMADNFECWVKNHETLPAEIWLKRKDGSIFPTRLTGASLFDDHGKLIGRTLALADLTEIYDVKSKLEENHKELQDQLKQLIKADTSKVTTERRYKDLFEKSPGLLRTISLQVTITDCNESYAKALGYSKKEAIGMSILDRTAQISHKAMHDNVEEWKKTLQVSHLEIWMKRKDGSIFPVLMSGGTLYDENDNPIGRTVVLTDLTEIHETQKRLQH